MQFYSPAPSEHSASNPRIVNLILFIFLSFTSISSSAQYIDRGQESALMRHLAKSQSDTNRIQLLISLGKFHTYKQAKSSKDQDSSFMYLNWARQLSDTLQVKYYQHQTESMIVTYMMNKGDLAVAEERYLLLLQDCQVSGDKRCLADAMFRHAICLSSANSNSSVAVREFTAAAHLYHELKSPREEFRMYYELAFINFNEGKIAQAETGLLDVIRKYKVIQSPKLHSAYNLLSTLYRIKGDFNKSFKYAMLTIASANHSRDTLRLAYYYGDLARIYLEVGDHEQEIAWYKKALFKWRQQGLAEYGMYLAQGYVIQDQIERHHSGAALHDVQELEREIPPISLIQKACVYRNYAICFDALKRNALAEKYYLDAVKFYTASKMNFEGSQEVYPQIGHFYVEQKQYNKAAYYLRPALAFNPQQLSLASIRNIHFMLFKVDSAEKKYLSAINHQMIGKELDDSLFNRTKIREMEKLQIQFKTAETDERYQHQAKLQSIRLRQAQQTQYVVVGFACVLFIISLLLLNQYRIKQTSNKQLRAKQIEISSQNITLQNLVKEKEWLVKEIHHRVKNNLQTIVSLLESQTGFLSNNDAVAAVKNSQHRIHAMSLIHQKLYLTENVSSVNLANYIRELVSYLSTSLSTSKKIIYELNLAPLEIDVAVAIPLGLILNEAITNAIKYAFTGDEKEENVISVKFLMEDLTYKLTIADNGIGLPLGFNNSLKINSLGMTLIKGLCKQIGATFNIVSKDGVTIFITFKPLVF